MAKIEIKPIEEGVNIATSAMQKKGIQSKIEIEKIPEDDTKKEGEFTKLIRMGGEINYNELKAEFKFYLPIPVSSHRGAKNWSWIIVYDFLGEALRILIEKKGWSDEAKNLWKIESDLVDELIQ